jgi:hypothetical protein
VTDQNSPWMVVGHPDAPKGKASLPRTWWELGGRDHHVSFVRITLSSNQTVALAIQKRDAATGYQVWVTPGTLGLGMDEIAKCTIIPLTRSAYRRMRVLHTRPGQWALGGLAAAIVGIVLDGTLKIGGEMPTPVVTVSEFTYRMLLILATFLEIVGVAVVFIRSVWLKDE